MITTTDHFEVFGDAGFLDLTDRFDDPLAEPTDRSRELLALLAPMTLTIPPSDVPAAELPDCEPTVADLLAIEAWANEEATDEEIDARIASANTRSAVEARHRDLLRLRAAVDRERMA